MEWKENMSKEEFEQAMAQAKQGLFSKEELDKQVQSETDKVRTEYSKKVKDLESKLPEKKTEKELELEKKEQELLAKENEYKVKDLLEQKELPTQLAKYLKFENIDTDVDEVVSVLNTYLLNNSHKPTKHNKNNEGITKEQFKKMSYAERAKLEQSNPELYKKLI